MQRINTPNGQFQAGDPSTGTPGTIVTMPFMQSLQEEIAGTVESAGIALDPNNNGQLLAAILSFIEAHAGEYLLDTGAANAYVVAMNPAVIRYASGLTVKFRIAHSISGNSTLNAGPGPVPLVRDDGTPTQNGDGPAGSIVTATYDAPAGAFLINSVVPSQIAAQIGAILAASPALGGTPTVPTAVAGTVTTQAASCEFVGKAIAGISVAQATETVAGIAQIATQAAATAGTDGTSIITPKTLAAVLAAIQTGIGVGQTWQDVTSSRAAGTTYTNTTGKPIVVSVMSGGGAMTSGFYLLVDGVRAAEMPYISSGGAAGSMAAVVPNGSSYSITAGCPKSYWSELR